MREVKITQKDFVTHTTFMVGSGGQTLPGDNYEMAKRWQKQGLLCESSVMEMEKIGGFRAMAVNCRACKHYQAMIKVRFGAADDLESLNCEKCADYPDKKSFYESIKHVPKDERGKLYFGQLPGE